jgi:serine/threonine-protein kinase RsbW
MLAWEKPMSERAWLRLNADLKDLTAIRKFVEDAARHGPGDNDAIQEMLIAVNEAVTNVIIHGYLGQPGMIEVEASYDNHDLVVRLQDQAPSFDPTTVHSPKIPPVRDQPYLGGMGIHMMRQLTDSMTYTSTGDGRNELTLIKKGVRHQQIKP